MKKEQSTDAPITKAIINIIVMKIKYKLREKRGLCLVLMISVSLVINELSVTVAEHDTA